MTPATCKEQLLYEIHDPAAYVTPDVVADFSRVPVIGARRTDRVARRRRGGGPRPETLKVSLGYRDGYIGEGQISYAGLARSRARDWPRGLSRSGSRLRRSPPRDVRSDLIGISALHGEPAVDGHVGAIRGAGPGRRARTDGGRGARSVGSEVEALYTNGPAGGGGATRWSVRSWPSLRRSCPRCWCRARSIGRWSDMKLRAIAHARSGDKGTTANISLIAFDDRDYPRLVATGHGRSRQGALHRSRRWGRGALRAAAHRRAQLRPVRRHRRRRDPHPGARSAWQVTELRVAGDGDPG